MATCMTASGLTTSAMARASSAHMKPKWCSLANGKRDVNTVQGWCTFPTATRSREDGIWASLTDPSTTTFPRALHGSTRNTRLLGLCGACKRKEPRHTCNSTQASLKPLKFSVRKASGLFSELFVSTAVARKTFPDAVREF